jgi:predicted DNA-binding protein
VTQRQDTAAASSQTSPLVRTSIDVDREKWARFEVLASANNRSRGAQIRELIDRSLKEFDAAA